MVWLARLNSCRFDRKDGRSLVVGRFMSWRLEALFVSVAGRGARRRVHAETRCCWWKLWVCIWALLVSAIGPWQAAGQSVPAGLSYLSASQIPSGTWGDPQGSAFRDTTVVLDTLGALGQSSSAGYAQGIASLQGSTAPNYDYLSRQAVSLAAAGDNVGALTTPLLDAQEAEEFSSGLPSYPAGGWGAASGFATDSLDTALALRALRAAGFEAGLTVVDEQVAVGAMTPAHPFSFPAGASGLSIFVRATTGAMRLFITIPAVGTGYVDLTPGNVPANIAGIPEQTGTYSLQVQNMDSVPISYSLEARFTTTDAFNVERNSRALRYLGLAQNPDGGWGIAIGEGSSLMITTEVLLTLEAYGGAFAPHSATDDGVDWLITNYQNPDGGFGSESGTSTAYETALAILAIHGADPASPALGPARAFLGTTQLPDGSWNDDSYATALALRALAPSALADVNCSGGADSIDGLFVLQHDVGLRPASNLCPPPAGALYLPLCDVNGDGQCNSIDALFILQCDVGIHNVLCP